MLCYCILVLQPRLVLHQCYYSLVLLHWWYTIVKLQTAVATYQCCFILVGLHLSLTLSVSLHHSGFRTRTFHQGWTQIPFVLAVESPGCELQGIRHPNEWRAMSKAVSVCTICECVCVFCAFVCEYVCVHLCVCVCVCVCVCELVCTCATHLSTHPLRRRVVETGYESPSMTDGDSSGAVLFYYTHCTSETFRT